MHGVLVYGGFAGDEAEFEQRNWQLNETILDGSNDADPWDGTCHVVTGADAAVLDGFTVTGQAFVLPPDDPCAALYNLNASPTVRNCAFTGNEGRGMWNEDSSPTIEGCAFIDNHGGMVNLSSDPFIEGCVFAENEGGDGGGMFNSNSSPTVVNCLFFDNESAGPLEIGADGGGMYNEDSSPLIVNSSFADNQAMNGTGGVYADWTSLPTLKNCILWGNDGAPIGPIASDVTYSVIEGGYDGVGNIDADPLFVDAGAGDLHLQAGSPCIDAADGDVATEFDIEGNPRIDDPDTVNTGVGTLPYVDMGAYEFQP
jgi:hypothetical protein